MTTENIAAEIREDRRPEGEIFTLSGEASRLHRSLGVVEKWIDTAFTEDDEGHLFHTAQLMRDQLEEELARACWRMQVLDRRRNLRQMRAEGPEGADEAAVLSDALLNVYCVLREVPSEEFGGEVPERKRYAHMGALLAAQEAAEAEERAAGEPT